MYASWGKGGTNYDQWDLGSLLRGSRLCGKYLGLWRIGSVVTASFDEVILECQGGDCAENQWKFFEHSGVIKKFIFL